MSRALPVTVVTGFLGAGKTTLVNRWLAGSPRGDIAVIVNEQGDVGIDGALLAARVRTIVEITGGCVCCATQADLARALTEIASSASPPARVLIETSGAASPAGVLRALATGGKDDAYHLDGVITVVDSAHVDGLAAHDLAIEQVGYADIVVLSRADDVDLARRQHAEAIVSGVNGAALVVRSAKGEIVEPAIASLDDLLERRRADFVRLHKVPSFPSHSVYESVSLVIDGAIDEERFADFMEHDVARFAGRLFRTKGILAVEGIAERMIVQGVADLVEVTFGEPWGDGPRSSRFVLVGYGLDRASLETAFRACAVRF